jgi:HAD superfamily hydrolase (TIGR01509 family)
VTAVLVLDFDGTVLDTEAPVFRSWAETYEAHGEELALGQWQSIIGLDAGFDPWAELERRVGHTLDDAVQERRRRRRDELLHVLDPRPGVLSWLERAEALGVPVGIASSSPPQWVEYHLDRLGLRTRFGCLACCDGSIPSKPDPTSYRHAVEQLGGDPASSVAVEDSAHGVAAAVEAGLFTIAVPHGLTRDTDLSSADVLLDSLEELTLDEALAQARRRASS